MSVLERDLKFIESKNDLKKQQRLLLFHRIIGNKLIVTGGVILTLLTLLALIAPIVVPYGPYEMQVENRLKAPSVDHLLGTDNFGRDLLSRIAYGARVSLGIGAMVAFFACLIGLIIGLLASYFKTLDNILMRICDGLMAIPGVLLAIALVAALGPLKQNVVIALVIVFIPNVARIVRSTALVIREETYIEAIRAQGASTWRIIALHIAPNTISPLVVQASFIFADAIITEAALSFLGAGIPAPNPSWGNILYDGKIVIFNAWWMTVFPGILIILSVLGLNLLGDGLRDLLDPNISKGKKGR
ncbi:ABC transporter permease [Niallia sp. RD1]|uniref:ABC transporter permease n=1 Tax=Niallia sp. RD1 TaxID=2962858 RepID=UPI0020C1A74E|nr:ABC transporter permease [Niallia sp. RD1]UTI42777.1 ABC transporter permease [Niallia sp. RD1]